MSWTGTEHQRQPQRGCKPPRCRNTTARFTIPAGARCLIRAITDDNWHPFTTTIQSDFDNYESFDAKTHSLIFRKDGWQIKVRNYLVKDSTDNSAKRATADEKPLFGYRTENINVTRKN